MKRKEEIIKFREKIENILKDIADINDNVIKAHVTLAHYQIEHTNNKLNECISYIYKANEMIDIVKEKLSIELEEKNE